MWWKISILLIILIYIKNCQNMKKPILAFLLGVGSIYSTQAQDSTSVEPTETTPPTEGVTTEEIVEDDMLSMDLEELFNMEVTSVSKKAERLQDVASSIYVVSSEDIAKSGATNLHEVLRTVPGYWGTQSSYNDVSPSIHFSGTANGGAGTVLYLLDGTPIQDLMGSTFIFNNFDIPLDEIDRIEVIRGSGGTVYGANSATGVVNIFTKNPEKYDGVNVRAEAANPNYAAASIRAGGQINEKLSLSGYAKYRHFGGFGTLSDKDSIGDFKDFDSRFTKDYDKQTMMSFGLKAAYKLSEKSKLSLSTHLNTRTQTTYTNSFEGDFMINSGLDSLNKNRYHDQLYENDVNSNRIVANLRYDYDFNDDHSLFLRASTNTENNFYHLGGGYSVTNSIYDFEVQDNISIGSMNDLSVGANYRAVNFDVHDINSTSSINYLKPQNTESITGAFIQDKVKFLDGKLNLIVGLKAENYSLINSKYYLSPMAKVSYIPVENVTLWGGLTQAYTTPGYNNTNVDLMLLQAATSEDFNSTASDIVYDGVYDAAISGGTPPQIAELAAIAFISSPSGQNLVDSTAGVIQSAIDPRQNVNFGLKNGTETVPTQYSTLEFGVRASAENRISFESSVYLTRVRDGLGTSPGDDPVLGFSPTNPTRFSSYVLYGNYVQGNIMGSETMFKIRSSDGVTFEIAHSWTEATWEYQKNGDFDINTLDQNDRDQTPDVPNMPKHVFRIKGYFDLPSKFNFSMGIIYATKFATQSEYKFNSERYENLFLEDGTATIGNDNSRTIVNLRIEKLLLEDKLSVYAFGNDIFNEGLIANTNAINNVTISQIKGMYGLGANYKF